MSSELIFSVDAAALKTAGLYVGLMVIWLMGLKANVGRARIKYKVNLGDGGNDAVYRAIRAQANAVEDVPVTLVGLVALACMGGHTALIHVLGIMLVVGRVLHAVGITQVKGLEFGRLIGTLLSTIALLGTGLSCLFYAVM